MLSASLEPVNEREANASHNLDEGVNNSSEEMAVDFEDVGNYGMTCASIVIVDGEGLVVHSGSEKSQCARGKSEQIFDHNVHRDAGHFYKVKRWIGFECVEVGVGFETRVGNLPFLLRLYRRPSQLGALTLQIGPLLFVLISGDKRASGLPCTGHIEK